VALDITALKGAIKAAFEKAKETPPPPPPVTKEAAAAVQALVLDTLAGDLAAAIEAYVLQGSIDDVQVSVTNSGGTVIGSGKQSNSSKLK